MGIGNIAMHCNGHYNVYNGHCNGLSQFFPKKEFQNKKYLEKRGEKNQKRKKSEIIFPNFEKNYKKCHKKQEERVPKSTLGIAMGIGRIAMHWIHCIFNIANIGNIGNACLKGLKVSKTPKKKES